ncbi:sodium-translocating pyrophosphatase [Rhabdothermincola salaria]|uniref:sodium-translocating pyrophosphatase n=1 Tax=Rhabdothermincola salaria TaxID=2903142 RepID=UPI001E552E48|nr:sodium-translocating pyrophosphatase [Rhabdothermincola salaria]MCD9625455.1 sodium-translocating pyrophosphatase [Rhabdothermincola salaria]
MYDVLAAAEGGWQEFTLGGTEWGWLIFVTVVALAALGLGVVLMKGVLAAEPGTDEMQEVAGAIQEGASAYLRRQFRTIGVIVVPLAIIVFLTSTEVLDPDGALALSFGLSGAWRTVAFLLGAVFSGAIGFFGMWLAVRGNVRTAAAARRNDFPAALKVAFRTGGVAGLLTAGLGLFGTVVIIMLFQNTASAILVGFGFGGSLLALFLRVGGGIFTKAADVGADLVGKVEAGIPEDDPRNPATIADNVGDNVGDCAGMASDLFESFAVVLVASVILGVSGFRAIGLEAGDEAVKGLMFPLIVMAIGLLASMVGIFLVRARAGESNALTAINRGIYIAQVLAVIGAGVVAFVYIGNPAGATVSQVGLRIFGAIVVGVILGFAASKITQFFTSTETEPVQEIAKAARTGPATTVLEGISSGLESAVWALLAIVVAIGAALGLGDGNIGFSLYLVALAGIGMLSTTAIVVAEDTFGPVADNAAGIAEMAGEFEGEPERIMVSLDAVGNTTKAVTKGFAIGSAVIAAVALFASFAETIAKSTFDATEVATAELAGTLTSLVQINVADPKTFIGLLVGGSIVFLFSSLAIRAVSRTAGTVVQEVRRQFREKPGIMDGSERPDYGPVIDICTTASLRELATPALLAVLTPVIIGFGIGYIALGAFLASIIVVGQLMANFLSNSGGAWDNAKKYIEDGNEGGKGSEAHKAAVIGDTVGDPFKDTAGPALNPLIKVMNLVSLLMLPAMISLEDNNIRFLIAGVALVVVLGAVAFSRRGGSNLVDQAANATDDAEAMAVMHGDRNATLHQAIDMWVSDLGHRDHELRERLLEVKGSIPESEDAHTD